MRDPANQINSITMSIISAVPSSSGNNTFATRAWDSGLTATSTMNKWTLEHSELQLIELLR